MINKSLGTFILGSLIILDAFVWGLIFLQPKTISPEIHFLDVGQGDSTLLLLPSKVKILTDAGPDGKVISSLEKSMPFYSPYIDLGIISHPQRDHYNGFNYLLNHYRFGAFLVNGRDAPAPGAEWASLLETIEKRGIPIIVIGEGDRIRYDDTVISILSPSKDFIQSGELNDTGIVELIQTEKFTTLLAADIGENIESSLLKKSENLRAHILKVGHHGSKYSSCNSFLEKINPRVAVIGVGSNNRYGHPAKEALERLASSTEARVFRTDYDGTVRIWESGGIIKISTEKTRNDLPVE
mgnify:CR=1 FL=1